MLSGQKGEVLDRDQESLVLVHGRRGDADVQRGEADRYDTSTDRNSQSRASAENFAVSVS